MSASSFTVPMRCSLDGRPFRVEFTRPDSSKKWRIDRVSPGMRVVATVGSADTTQTAAPKLRSDEVDWAGWHCAVCGYGRANEGQFVQCGTCRDLICGATVRNLDEQIRTFECHPTCGGAGRITGDIQDYSGTETTTAQPLLGAREAAKHLRSGHDRELPPARPRP